MTAINCFRLRKSVIVMTDAAYYDADGKIGAIADKSIALPAARAVIAVRGTKGVFDDISGDLNMSTTFDRMISTLPATIREIMSDSHFGDRRQEVLIAGWSNVRKQGESYLMFTQDHRVGDGAGGTVAVPGYSLLPLPAFVAAPSPPANLLASYGLLSPPKGREIEPRIEGIRLMEAQRRTKGHLPYATVGGFVRAHTITAKGVVSQIVHRWSDVIGEPITVEAKGEAAAA